MHVTQRDTTEQELEALDPEDQLIRRIEQLERRLMRLADLLRLESDHVVRFEISALMALLPQKEACLDALLRTNEAYRPLMIGVWVSLGQSIDALPDRLPEGLAQLAELDGSDRATTWRRCAERMLALEHEVSELQERNATLSRRSIQWIEACLERLQRHAFGAGYDRRGRRRTKMESLIERRA